MRSIYCALLVFLLCICDSFGNESNFRDIRQLIEYLQTENVLPALQEPVYARDILMDIYQSNSFQPLWNNKEYAVELINELKNADNFGLLPQDYHAFILDRMAERDLNSVNPQFDVLLTDGLLLYSHHLLNGKLDPEEFFFSWNLPKRTIYQDSISDFLRNSRKELVLEDLKEHHPTFQLYWDMVAERQKWKDMRMESVNVQPIIYEKPVKPGETSSILPDFIEQMKRYFFIPQDMETGALYDSAYIPFIKKFQVLHGIESDGIIGQQTVKMLNLTPEERILQIDINLERLRWISEASDNDMIFVNIAGFHLFVVKNRKVIWDTPVMTGAVDTQTPVFSSQMKYLVFNPSWTVPRGILQRSLFQKMKSDPGFLSTNNYTLYDTNGSVIDPSSIPWSEITLKEFPYTVVQNPGPNNAMGVVKFMFPNKHSIYLHDTPSKALFNKSARAFSNGCIRVKDPLVLAEKILDNDKKYSLDKLKEIVNSKSTQTVFLKEPVNVLLVYLTVDKNINNDIIFRSDIYNRDPALGSKLKIPLKN